MANIFESNPLAAASNDQSQEQPMVFKWELPLWLQTLPADTGRRTQKDFIFDATALVARGEYIELFSCKQCLENFHPERGVELVEAIMNALNSSDRVTVEKDMVVTALDDGLMSGFQQGTASRNQGHRRSFVGNTFTMTTETPLNDLACWVKLFNNAVVVVKPSDIFPEGGPLKLSFEALLQLTAVEYPVLVDSGLIFMGFSTALIPTKINSDGQILWHLEVSSDDA